MSSERTEPPEEVKLQLRKHMVGSQIWNELDLEGKREFVVELEKLADEMGVEYE